MGKKKNFLKSVEWHRKGQEYFKKGDYSGSIEVYKRALKYNSKQSEIWYDLGAAYKFKGENNLFIDVYKQALSIELKRGSKKDLVFLDRNIVDMGDLKMLIISLLIMSIVVFLLSPIGALYLIILCLCVTSVYAYGKKRNREPKRHYDSTETDIREFRRILESDPTDIFYWIQLISTYTDLEHYQKAVNLSKTALVVEPNNIKVMRLLAQAYYEQGRFDQALDACTKALEIDEENLEICQLMGKIYQTMKKYEKSTLAYIKVLENSSERADIQKKLFGNMLHFLENAEFEKQVLYCQQILEVEPRFDKIWMVLGIGYIKLEDRKGATAAYIQAISIDPNNKTSMLNLCEHYFTKGRVKDALEICNQYLRIDPFNTRAKFLKDKIENSMTQ